jgi:hypothetical protein
MVVIQRESVDPLKSALITDSITVNLKRKMNRRWTQMNIDVKRLTRNWTLPLWMSANINTTL